MKSERYNASSVLERNLDARPRRQARGDRRRPHAHLRRADARGEPMGHLLRALGVRREARVLMVLDDTTAFPVTFVGAMRIGAVPVPVSTLDKDDNFRHFVDDSYAEVVVADEALLPRLRDALAGRELTFLVAGDELSGGPRSPSRTTSSTPRADAPRRRRVLALQLAARPACRRASSTCTTTSPFTCETLRRAGAGNPRGRRGVLDDQALPRVRARQRR